MIPIWLQILFYVLSAVSALITIALFILIQINVDNFEIKFRSTKLLSKILGFKAKMTWVLIAAIFTAGLIIISVLLSQDTAPPVDTPVVTISSPTQSPNQPIPKKYYLNDIDPTITNPDAFFDNCWSRHRTLVVDHEEYAVGIGIRIPLIKQREYTLHNSFPRIEHKEVLEYKLCRKYKELTFSYGVDDCSFDGFVADSPSGVCRILMQYAESNQFLGEDENILYESDEITYHLIKHDVTINVSQVESLRITVYWRYDADPTQRNCLSLAILNPILYLKDS